jgi:capsular exopolysaccharide synthesis family protein
VVKVEEVLALDAYTTDYYPTQHRLLRSRSLAANVINKLALDKNPAFIPQAKKKRFPFSVRQAVASVVRLVIPKKRTHEEPDTDKGGGDSLTSFINIYLGMLKIEPLEDSRLVSISFEGRDPSLVTEMTNAHARAYISRDLELKLVAAEDAVDWLGGRLEELRGKLLESEGALQQFQEEEDILALESLLSGSGGKEENIVAQQVIELSSNITAARTERISLEPLYLQLKELRNKPDMAESIPQVIQNSLIQSLKSDYIMLRQEYSKLRGKYGEKHPRMVALRREIGNLRSRIRDEVNKIGRSVEFQYEMLLAKEKKLQAALEEAKSEVMGLNKRAIQYGVLKREVESNRQIYNMILRRAKETSLTSRLKSTNIFIVDLAETPQGPVRPNLRKNLLMAVVITMMIGLALAFFLEHWDNTLHSPNDVKRYLAIPFLGPVGLFPPKGNGKALNLAVLREPKSSLAEALRNVRTNLIFSFVESHQKAMVITSPGPMEGKTFVSSNLAVTMAQMGRRVVLIDADMRKPSVNKVFGISLKPGLSDLILGRCKLNDAMQQTPVKSLRVISAGTIPPNSSELLTSTIMQKLLNYLRDRFDYLIFDTPPILVVTDAAVLSGILDGTVLVIKASETTREAAQRALERLSEVHSRPLGVVLNQVDFRRERYHYNYYYSNYYYYSDEGDKRVRRVRTDPRQGQPKGKREPVLPLVRRRGF